MKATTNTIKTVPPSVSIEAPARCVYLVADRHRCAVCGQYHDERDMYEHDGKWYCGLDCLEADNLTLCDYCGEVLSLSDCEEMPDGSHVCDSGCAIELGFEYCEYCGNWIASDDCIICGNCTVYCSEECANANGWHKCDDCGEWTNDYFVDHNGRVICCSCYDYDYCYCEGCGEIWNYSECEYSEWDQCYYCPECMDEHGNILSYGYKPTPVFYGKDGPYLGVELEIDEGNDRNECAREITSNADGAVYIKSDSSLYDGLEIVSHPATLDAHIDEFDWPTWCNIAKQNGFKSHDADTCGLHIHIDVAYYVYQHISRRDARARIWALVNFHKKEMVRFSRRDSDRWAPYASEEDKRSMYTEKYLSDFIEDQQRSRYKAVNLTNDTTIELRLFKGSLNIETVHATIAFADGLARYAVSHSHRECARVPWAELTAYILDTCTNETAKAALASYLKRRELD